MNIFQVLADVLADVPDFKALADEAPAVIAELKMGKMPTPAQVAVLEKVVEDIVKIAHAL